VKCRLAALAQTAPQTNSLLRGERAAGAEYPRARRLLIVLESRMPFPEVPATVRIVPAWQWLLTHEGET
jgi:hypothetical protein